MRPIHADSLFTKGSTSEQAAHCAVALKEQLDKTLCETKSPSALANMCDPSDATKECGESTLLPGERESPKEIVHT